MLKAKILKKIVKYLEIAVASQPADMRVQVAAPKPLEKFNITAANGAYMVVFESSEFTRTNGNNYGSILHVDDIFRVDLVIKNFGSSRIEDHIDFVVNALSKVSIASDLRVGMIVPVRTAVIELDEDTFHHSVLFKIPNSFATKDVIEWTVNEVEDAL